MAAAAEPTVVHVHHRRWALLATVAARSIPRRRRPVVVEHVHNVFSDRRLTSFRGDLLVAAGSGVAEMLVGNYHRDPRRVRVLLNTAGGAAPPADRRPPDVPGHVVFGVGRLVADKRPAEWVEVVRRLRAAGVVTGGVWMGDGPLFPELTAPEVDGVDFVGSVDDVEQRLRRHRGVLLVTSVREALPLAILEAMANGVPVVARDVGSIRDAVVPGTSGVLLPAAAPPADFARAVAAVCRDGTYDRLSAGAQAHFRARFTAEAFFGRLDEIYEEGYEQVRRMRREPVP
jgi:glycosyltransferase involved in cell wall biosynthesis